MNSFLARYNAVDFHYRDNDGEITGRRILSDINLNIRSGEFVTICGPSGCGKTTLLNLLLGSHHATAGSVFLDETLVDRVDGTRGIVYQKYSLFPHLNVLDNIAIGLVMEHTTLAERLLFLPRSWRVYREARARAREYLHKIGFTDADGKKYPTELSGGMQQRVAIAAAAILEPKVLLMDEPFSALDDTIRREMQAFALKLWEETNLTILFVTHNVEEAVHLGTRLLGLSQHWDDGSGRDPEGARIVSDLLLPRGDEDRRLDQEFVDIMKHIRTEVLDKSRRLPIASFRFNHPDSIKPTL